MKKAAISKSRKDTDKLAKSFLLEILRGKSPRAVVVGLYGELGAGKTAFVQSIVRELGVKRRVPSPTFVIIRKYGVRSPRHRFLFHLDAYRLKSAKEIKRLGWQEIISSPEHLVFVEWPEKIRAAMPRGHRKVHIEHRRDGSRKFRFS
ncbi:MAG TPA: tRNA (adenosine(37)-N6)-threonylcarbamoyltransferase complex ATPase subunit type 1 TsaE [Candidatus Paceibacterota bacterium]|nr:tRNA (adenosine(37)-N6)-threonylcarbamoyltransferase complex ATPase subunit type 1 TsaE [Candidatus Paceibacterota bacterium]